MNKEINKDFYDYMPAFVCALLDDIILEYEYEDWFEEAWEEYRQHILSVDMLEQRMPGFVFRKYIER